jgi:hypothetical protein
MVPDAGRKKVGAVEAWIGFRLNLDPSQLALIFNGNRYAAYEHAQLGKITINHETLCTKHSLLSGAGLECGDFIAFRNGFEGKGKRPWFGKKCSFYDIAADAHAKWGMLEIPVRS